MKITKTCFFLTIAFFSCLNSLSAQDEAWLRTMHTISSHDLYDYVAELTHDKYEGRLTGTEGYDMSAQWVADQYRRIGLLPLDADSSYFQWFDIPYTLVTAPCRLTLHVDGIQKHYNHETEFMPGSTSGSGQVTAEVVYCGYGISAPELGYDDYKGVDVKGKIVLIEREVPVSPDTLPQRFQKWRPYSFHQYKLQNAAKHGAAGMLYNYGPIANPNNDYIEGFLYTHVGDTVVKDLFSGTDRNHTETIKKIRENLKPRSFRTQKRVTIENFTEYHPEGRGANVIGILEGSDPELKKEAILLGGHLDHMGHCWKIIPGANDNASAVAVMLGVADALAKIDRKRSVILMAFGAEEQAIVGSDVYLKNPLFPLENTVCLLNMDGVGVGANLWCIAGENYPGIWNYLDQANQQYVHRPMGASFFHNRARPRLDAARFLWKGIPTISMTSYGADTHYHTSGDNISIITPEIMEDLAQILFLAVAKMVNDEQVNVN